MLQSRRLSDLVIYDRRTAGPETRRSNVVMVAITLIARVIGVAG
jgi:hypothetical protein